MLSNTLFKKCIIKHNSNSISNTLEKENINENKVVIQKDLDNTIDPELNDEKVDFSNTLEDLENNEKNNKEDMLI